MPSRIVTYVHRPKRPPRKRKAVALQVQAVVATRSVGNRQAPPPVDDQPEHAAPPPANDDSPTAPAPPAAKSAIVTVAARKRAKSERAERNAPEADDDPEADARVKAFLARMIRPGGALPPEKP